MSDIACAFAYSACVVSLSMFGHSVDLAVMLFCTYYETLVLVFVLFSVFVFLFCFPLYCVLYVAALVSRR